MFRARLHAQHLPLGTERIMNAASLGHAGGTSRPEATLRGAGRNMKGCKTDETFVKLVFPRMKPGHWRTMSSRGRVSSDAVDQKTAILADQQRSAGVSGKRVNDSRYDVTEGRLTL